MNINLVDRVDPTTFVNNNWVNMVTVMRSNRNFFVGLVIYKWSGATLVYRYSRDGSLVDFKHLYSTSSTFLSSNPKPTCNKKYHYSN